MKINILEKTGENIRVLRNVKGFSQEGLSNIVGKSQNWLQKVEIGDLDISLSNLDELATALGVSLNYLISFQPQQVFHNCTQSGTFNNCNFNSEKFFGEVIKLINDLKAK